MNYQLYRLHNFDRGTRVHFALEAAGVGYHMSFAGSDQKADDAFANKNPFGTSPILTTPEGDFFDSAAAVLYLRSVSEKLASNGMLDIAQNGSWFQFVSSSVDSVAIPAYYFNRFYLENHDLADKQFIALKKILDVIDHHIAQHNGISSTPEVIDATDCMFLYILSALNLTGDVDKFQNIREYLDRRINHPVVERVGAFKSENIQYFLENVVPARRIALQAQFKV